MKNNILFYSALIFVLLPSLSIAQDISLKGRSAIELNLGLWGGAEASNNISLTGVKTEANASGFSGNLGYTHWMKEYFCLTLNIGMLSGQVSNTVNITNVTQQASAVFPLQLGIRYYLPNPEPGDDVRPFLSASIGPYFGMEAKNSTLSQEAHSESTFGGRLGVGMDFLLSNHFMLGAQVGYNIMADFKTSIGARKNFNGADFSIAVGIIF